MSNLSSDEYDRESVLALATAYETMLLKLSSGAGSPDRDTRTLIMRAMLSEGRSTGFDPARLKEAASAALGRHPHADYSYDRCLTA